jgi:hypothetical protein
MNIKIDNNFGSFIINKEGGVLNLYQDHAGKWKVTPQEVQDAQVIEPQTAPIENNPEPLSRSRRMILERLDALIRRGEWLKPATAENIQKMMRDVLNQGDYALQGADRKMSDTLWNLLEHRKGDAVRVTWQNLIGYFIHNRFLPMLGSPKMQEMFFKSVDDYTNIDKGKPDSHYMPERFRQILPLLDQFKPKYP